MSEEERLDLVSSVEDEFSEPLERFENALNDVDDEIRETGGGEDSIEIDVEVRGVEEAIAELESLDAVLDDIDDKVDLDSAGIDMGAGAGGGGATAMTSGGRDTFEFDPQLRRASIDAPGDTAAGMFSQTASEAMGMPGGWGNRRRPQRSFVDILRETGKEITEFRFTMGKFHQIVASLIPLLVVFIGALPAAIVGVGALATAALGAAAALGGIAGLGAMGLALSEGDGLSMEPIKEQLSEVTDSFVNAFGPLAQSFVPLFENAITDIRTMMDPLADASALLLNFRDDFDGFVSFVSSAIPSFTRDLLAFTDAAMPILTGLGQMLANTDFFGILARQLNRGLTSLIFLGQSIAQIIPMVMNLSHGFLVVATTLMTTIEAISWLLNLSPLLTKALGVIIGALITLISLSTVWTMAVNGLSLALARNLVSGLNAAIASKLGFAAATWKAYFATAAFLSLVTLGAVYLLPKLADQFDILGSNVRDARKELEKFGMTTGQLRGGEMSGGTTATGSGANVYNDNSTTVIYADDRDSATRQQYSSEYERQQHRDSVFGG